MRYCGFVYVLRIVQQTAILLLTFVVDGKLSWKDHSYMGDKSVAQIDGVMKD